MRKSKWIGLLAVLLVACMLFTACNEAVVPEENGGDETTAPETTPEETTTKKPQSTTQPPVSTTPPPADDPAIDDDLKGDEDLLLQGANISYYTIVYGRSQMEKKYNSATGKTAWDDLMNSGMKGYENMLQGENIEANFDYETAMRLQKLIFDKFGYELDVVKDADRPTRGRFEILVGFTDRPATTDKMATLKIDQYYCGFNDTTDETQQQYTRQYVICGGSYGATWHAIDEIEEIFAKSEKLDITTEMNVTKAYDFKAVATIGDSITRGSQGFPDGSGYGDASGFGQKIAGSAAATYLEKFLSWPAVLQRDLWKDYLICNYGRGWSTMRDTMQDVYPDPGPVYYAETAQFAALLAESNREDFEFDWVLIMLGTNDAGTTGGADKWNPGQKEEFYQEAEMLLYRITHGSPNAKFVFMNAPHRCDGNPASEKNDAKMREIQLTVAKRLQADGYTIRFYDMESYTAENLVEEGKTCAEKAEGADKAKPEDLKKAEIEAHGHYYNLLTDTGTPDATHPSYLGYGRIAAGVKEMILHLFDPENVSAPKYMVSLDVE